MVDTFFIRRSPVIGTFQIDCCKVNNLFLR